MTKAFATIEEIGKQIDTIVEKCMPITNKQAQGFNEALILAGGIKQMRELFLTSPEIKANVMAMADTPLGFMTDRSPAAIKSSKKDLSPYDYNQIAECCIEAMLQGYRITGNEFNIISERFYPAKNGKYRKIIENENISNFFFTNTSPLFSTEQRMNYGKPDIASIAKVQCFATWTQTNSDGQRVAVKLGYGEDKLIFKVKVNAFMGDDGIVGKALSKLFSRVLMRVEGKMIPEATDIDEAQVINQEEPESNLADKLAKIGEDPKENPLFKTPEYQKWVETKEMFPDIVAVWQEPVNTTQCIEAVKEVNKIVDQQV